MSGKRTDRVFISYSHDSPTHANRVLELANQLRRDGVDAWLDRYKPHHAGAWPRWMKKHIEEATSVLVVCSPLYRRRFEGQVGPGQERGITWEWLVASETLDQTGGSNERLIPVLFDGDDDSVPARLRPCTCYKLPEQYPDLLRHLTLGKKRQGPVKPRKAKKAANALPALRASTSPAPDPSRVESPFVVSPPAEKPEQFFGRQRELEELRRALAQRQAVQLVGETRMGKSSLLARVPDLLPKDRPVVHINALGLAGRSSKDLVLALACSLDRRREIEGRTKDERTDSFVATIELLAPCAVLLDGADAIAQGRGFDKRFFEQCRTLCQQGRLIWVSASHSELGALFQQKGVVSRFLKDSNIVHVGQLEPEAADALVSVLGPALARRARELAGGFPLGLQWLGHELWRNGDHALLGERYANAMRIHFGRWWERLDGDQRRLLKRAGAGVPTTKLDEGERSQLSALVQRGLAERRDGSFGLPGAAWRAFVAGSE